MSKALTAAVAAQTAALNENTRALRELIAQLRGQPNAAPVAANVNMLFIVRATNGDL